MDFKTGILVFLWILLFIFLWCINGSAIMGRNNLAVFWTILFGIAAFFIGFGLSCG